MDKILWLLDIGNSSLTLAQKKGEKLSPLTEFSDDKIPNLCQKIGRSGSNSKKVVVICSVVPKNEKKSADSVKLF